MNQLEAYVEGWRRHRVAEVLATLTEDCVVIESFGPTYRGHRRVEQWMQAWVDTDGRVDAWEITSQAVLGDSLCAEWHFEYTWKGRSNAFDGATVARLEHGQIAYLREYATTAPLYAWTGQWRD